MEYPANGGQFDAHRLMQVHEGLKPKPANLEYVIATLANVFILGTSLPAAWVIGSSGSPAWLAIVEAAAPWIAVGAALCFPNRCSFFRGGSGVPLFGVLFFAALAPLGAYGNASLVSRLSGIEMGMVAGVLLCALAAAAEIRAKAGFQFLAILLPLSLLYGYGNAVQVNWVLDDSPAKVYKTVVAGKSTYRGLHLDLEPWGGNPDSKSPLTRSRVSVPRATFDAVEKGGPVCIEQRKGTLGMAWFSVRACR